MQIISILKRVWKISKILLLTLLVLIVLVLGLIRIPSVQNYVAQQSASWLSNKLHTKVEVKGFSVSFLDKISLDGVFIQDLQKDTLLFVNHLELKMTDWIVFKDEKSIKFIGLKDAYINLNRPKNDSVWNYQFIADAFASDKKNGNSEPLSIQFKDIQLEDVRFRSIDKWFGEDYDLNIGSLNIGVDKLDFKNMNIAIHKIELADTRFALSDYREGRPALLKRKKRTDIDTTPFNPDHWQIQLNTLALKDVRFIMDNPDEPSGIPGLFYEWKMDISPIQLSASNLVIKDDTLTAKLNSLFAKDRSGIEIKQMSALVKVTPRLSECKDLYLETNNSVLKDYYAMQYDRFPDFLEYMEKVRMEGRFKGSHVAMNDIAYFAPEMKLFKDMEVELDGTGGGTVDKLYANKVTIKDGKSNLFVDEFTMDGLPDIDNTSMLFRGSNWTTSGLNLLNYFPELGSVKTVNWLALGKMEIPFEALGSINDLKIDAKVNTEIGKLAAKGTLANLLGEVPGFDANIALERFDLGTLLQSQEVGKADAQFAFSGKGFSASQLDLKTDGTFSKLFLKGYDYSNLGIVGTITPNKFDGIIKLADTNANLSFDAHIENLSTKPKGDIKGEIKKLNLRSLGILDEEVKVQGLLSGHFDGISVDAMMGDATLKQMKVTRDEEILNIDSIYMKSLVEDDIRYLYLGTNNIAARLWGNYKIVELPRTFQHFLSKYLPNYFEAPKTFDPNQLIYFDVASGNINDLLSIFNKSIQVPQGAKANGFLNSSTDVVSMDAILPKLSVNGLLFDSVFVKGSGNKTAFAVDAGTAEIGYGSNVFLKKMSLHANLNNSLLDFRMTTATPDAFGEATLNGIGEFSGDQVLLKILPSTIFVNNNNWEIPAGNEILYSKNKLSIKNLAINSDNQHIYINDDSLNGDANIRLVNLGIAPMSRLLQLDNMISGGAFDGTLTVENPIHNPILQFDIQSGGIKVQGETLQSMRVKGRFDQGTGDLFLDPLTGIADKEGSLAVNGNWNFKSKGQDAINGFVSFKNAKVSWLNPVLKDYVNQLDGRILGTVKLTGSSQKVNADGTLNLLGLAVRPEVLGERYTIPNATIALEKDLINLGEVSFTDMQGNTGLITGTIKHRNLIDYFFDARVKSEKLRVLNLSVSEAERYYGTIDAVVDARITGDATDIKMQASLVPLENSTLLIPLDFSSDVGTYNYIKFKRPDQIIPSWRHNKLKFSTKYNVRIDATINNNLITNIIFDPKTNDELYSRGDGNISMEIPSDGDIRLNGNYKIESGYYNFTYRQMQVLNYNRKFDIVPGSTIVWSGDLYDAHLNITGVTTVKARLYDLISNEVNRINLSSQEISDAQLSQIIDIRLFVNNTLKNPDMSFKVELTENRSIATYAYQKLERINNDDKQLLNQVASLLLLGQFAPPEGFMNNTAAVTSGTLNNVSEIVSNVASNQLTNWANRLFKVEDLHVAVQYKNYNLNTSLNNNTPGNLDFLNRNEAKVSVRKNFFKNRLLVDVGGAYDWGRPGQIGARGDYTSNLAGDFLVQYLIRKDGRVRFNIFRTSDYDALYQQNVSRQGVGISYRRSFNTLWELLGVQKKDTNLIKDTLEVDTIPRKSDTSLNLE